MIRKPHLTKKPAESKAHSKRRLIENEALVRKDNEKVQRAVEAAFPPKELPNLRLHFYCECADVKCEGRIMMSPDDYKKIHRHRRRFVVKPDHLVLNIERVVVTGSDYAVIEKIPFALVRRLLGVRYKTKKPTPPQRLGS